MPTRREARRVLIAMRNWYARSGWFENGAPEPTLYDHTHEEQSAGSWSIAWEGGLYDWPMDFADRVFTGEIAPLGLHLEPINGVSLGIYAVG